MIVEFIILEPVVDETLLGSATNPIIAEVVMDGESAYEVWLSNGNSGTEQDFLDSLKGGGTDWVLNETPAGLVNGINATFTTEFNFKPGKVSVKLNGLTQKIISDYQTIGTNTIQFTESPTAGETILIDYIKQ